MHGHELFPLPQGRSQKVSFICTLGHTPYQTDLRSQQPHLGLRYRQHLPSLNLPQAQGGRAPVTKGFHEVLRAAPPPRQDKSESRTVISTTRGTQRSAQSMVLAELRLATFCDRLRRSATTPAQASLLAAKHLVLPQSALLPYGQKTRSA